MLVLSICAVDTQLCSTGTGMSSSSKAGSSAHNDVYVRLRMLEGDGSDPGPPGDLTWNFGSKLHLSENCHAVHSDVRVGLHVGLELRYCYNQLAFVVDTNLKLKLWEVML